MVHCPYCHGWEVRDQPIGIVATGPMSMHGALLFRQWTDDLVVFTNDRLALPPEEAEKLKARGTRIVDGAIERIESEGGRITGVRLASGEFVARTVLATASRMEARAGFLQDLGLGVVSTLRARASTSRPTRSAGPTSPGCGSRATSRT